MSWLPIFRKIASWRQQLELSPNYFCLQIHFFNFFRLWLIIILYDCILWLRVLVSSRSRFSQLSKKYLGQIWSCLQIIFCLQIRFLTFHLPPFCRNLFLKFLLGILLLTVLICFLSSISTLRVLLLGCLFMLHVMRGNNDIKKIQVLSGVEKLLRPTFRAL